MNTVANILVLVGLPAAIAFPIVYAARSPWRALRVGRSMMYLAVSLGALMCLNAGSIWFPDYPGRGIVRVIVYSALALSMWGQLRTLVKVQNGEPGYVSELHTAQREKENH